MIRIIYAICLLTIISCSGDNDTSQNVLSEDEMTNILLDIYITEAKVTNYTPHIKFDNSKVVFEALQNDILEKHDVSEEQLRQSLEYYFKRPDELDVIYGRVIDSLNLKVQKMENTAE